MRNDGSGPFTNQELLESETMVRWFGWMTAAVLIGLVSATTGATAKPVLRVAYAGSMGTVMDRDLGPTFARSAGVTYHGIGHGSFGLARLLAAGRMQADVFIGVTPGPARILLHHHMIARAMPVASTQMVIAFSPHSRYKTGFQAAKAGKTPWYKVLEKPGVRFGRTDPATDPQGRNIIFTFQLAQRYYHQSDLVKRILGSVHNPKQIFTESSLLTRLESGQIDASSGYLSAVKSRGLPYVSLPAQINLSNPRYMHSWYRHAGFELTGQNGQARRVHPEPLVFYAAVMNNAPRPKLARRFVKFLKSAQGQRILKRDGYSAPHGQPLR